LAASLDPDLVVFDGSGAALPPIAAGARVLVVGAHQDPAVATGYLNAYRHRLADLVVLTSSDDEAPRERLRAAAAAIVRDDVPVVATVLRPRASSTLRSPRQSRRPCERSPLPAGAPARRRRRAALVEGADGPRARCHRALADSCVRAHTQSRDGARRG